MENHSFGTNLLFLVLFICQMLFVCCAKAYSNISCIGSERQALLDFKKGLIDESNRLSSWMGENCCKWEGIGCNIHTGRVVKLDLHNPIVFDEERYNVNPIYQSSYDTSCLKGRISPSLLNLKYLQHLDLSCNNFSGHKIPRVFGSFKYMRYLNLSSSHFHGQIPTDLGNLSRLQHLDLGGGNDILNSKSLWWVTTLSSLKSLNLFDVNLTRAIDWLQAVNMLPSLFSLNLASCSLQNPSILSNTNFTSLVSLDLSDNDFNTSFPHWLFNVSSIEILILKGNSFRGELPNSLCNMTSLTHINIAQNKFEGAIPFEIGHLQKLIQLDLSFNLLNGTIPLSLGKLEKLQFLNISLNSFSGELTEIHFAMLTELKYLDVSMNSLRLNVNSQWFPPFQLREILMNGIQVGPQFPQWLETQKRVETLRMYNASISDQIPNWFEVIYSQIRILKLSHNQITGKPPQIKGAHDSHGFQYESYVDLSFNKFDGSLNSIPRYTYGVIMSSNYLTGQIPPLDGNQTMLLILDNNGFTGSIPRTICNQEALKALDLSNNHLSGEIPFCLGNLQQLLMLNLANNSLFGRIPRSLGNLRKELKMLVLNENKFHGNLPATFHNLTSLRFLDLGNNQLSGTLPRWLGAKLQDLVWLGLQLNNFYGSIPSELCKLSRLGVLNLAQNNFTGLIPRCFGNFTTMKEKGFETLDSASFWFSTSPRYVYSKVDFLSNSMKGIALKYSTKSRLAISISLSENMIVGEIPKELMDLENLQSLNLSKNLLQGRIPDNIGNLKRLESLDLSMNELSGSIPPSLATVDTLEYLNLSFNKLSGPIPEGNHFQTLDDKSIYEGNRGLCGKPLSDNCADSKPSIIDGSTNLRQGDSFDIHWFYAGIGPGLAVGLVGVFSVLQFKKSWRYAYFKFVEDLCSRM